MNNGFGSVQLEVVIAESTTRLPEHWLCAQPRVAGEAAPCAAGPVTREGDVEGKGVWSQA